MHSEMQVSASASKKNQVALPVCTFYMCEIQCLIFELYTNMLGGGQISHNSSIKRFFVQVSSSITTWNGCTLKFLTFIFLHWFMQCPSPRPHDFSLPDKDDKNFISHVLYKSLD